MAVATNFSLTGPNFGNVNVATAAYTITLNGTFTGTITPSCTLAGTFSPASLTYTGTSANQTFTFTPSAAGSGVISCTNSGTLAENETISFTSTLVPISVITTAGGAAIASASMNGPAINIASFKIGSDLLINDSTTTLKGLTSVQSNGANAAVYTMASTSQLQYTVLSANEVAYIITLDETVGNFQVGNVGLYTNTGALFEIVALSEVTSKTQTSGSVLGNRRVFECIVNFANASTISNLTTLTEFAYNLATVANENYLPSPVNPIYNIYLVETHTLLGIPVLAVSNNSSWNFVPTSTPDPENNGAVLFPSNYPGLSNTNPGDAIYLYNNTIGIANPSSGVNYYPIGVKGYGNYVHFTSTIFTNATQPYTTGTYYFCSTTGNTGNVVSATSAYANLDAPVGLALSSSELLVQLKFIQLTIASNLTVESSLYVQGTITCNPATGTSQPTTLGQFTNGSNANGYWRRAPDGFIEQWGTINTNSVGAGSVTFPIPMTTTTYKIDLQTGDGPAVGDAANVGGPPSPSQTGFIISTSTASGTTPSGPVGVRWGIRGF